MIEEKSGGFDESEGYVLGVGRDSIEVKNGNFDTTQTELLISLPILPTKL